MKSPNSIQINIPKPCHEDWSKMTQQEQGKFCSKCQTYVTDFTGFTDERLYKFLTEHKGQKLCGRFLSTQLNRLIHLPPQPHSQLYKWIIAAGLALIFTVNPGSNTFAKPPFTECYTPQENSNGPDTFSVKGKVVDERNEPALGATITLTKDGKTIGGGVADFDGNFIIKPVPRNNYNIKVEYIGYKPVNLDVNTTEYVNVTLTEYVGLSTVIVTEYKLTGLIDLGTPQKKQPDTLTLPHRETSSHTVDEHEDDK